MTESELVAVIEEAAEGGSWNAAAWLVERRWPERWLKPTTRPSASTDAVEAEREPEDPFGAVIDLARRRKR